MKPSPSLLASAFLLPLAVLHPNPAAAQTTWVRNGETAAACTNPRATLALSNRSDPRQSDPHWVTYVMNDGGCTRLREGVPVYVVVPGNAVTQVEYPRGSGSRLYVASSSLVPVQVDERPQAPSTGQVAPAPEAVAVPAVAGWTSTASGQGASAACGVSGPAGPGRLDMVASADLPGAVRLVLTKPSWHMPARSTVFMVAIFSDRTSLVLTGTGRDTSASFPMTDATRQWVHEFTAATGGKLTFPGSTEAPWVVDLAGTSAVVNAMSDCVQASGSISAPFPFQPVASQPFASTVPARPDVGAPPPPNPDVSDRSASFPSQAYSPPAQLQVPSSAENVLVQWRGETMMTTRPFQVNGPWELRWKSDGFFSAVLHRIDRDDRKLVANQSGAGASTAYQPSGGSYYLEITAMAPWTAQAVSLAEAGPRDQMADATPAAAAYGGQPKSRLEQPAREAATGGNVQSAFLSTVANYIAAYNSAPNDMMRGATRPARGRELCQVLQGGGARDWTGTIYSLSSNSEGKGVVEIKIGKDTYVTTWNNALSDYQDKTLIPVDSALFRRVSQMAVGQAIRFSGDFLHDDLDCAREKSVSVSGAMTEPEFLIRFSDIRAAP